MKDAYKLMLLMMKRTKESLFARYAELLLKRLRAVLAPSQENRIGNDSDWLLSMLRTIIAWSVAKHRK